jgi:beta-xylosidase
MLCLGAARAERIEGPWHDLGQPLLRDATVGMIDAHRYDDGGQAWLLWKADGNAFKPARPTPLFVQRLDADGITLVGERREIMHNDLPWEGDVVEGPWIVKRPDALYLFYAANKFNSEKYATGVARAATIDGEFVKKPEPILTSSSRGVGPGHGCAVTFKGRDLFIYHAWDEGRVDKKWNEPTYPRKAHVDEIHWGADGWPRIGD